MKRYYSRLTLLLFTIIMVGIFSGCSSNIDSSSFAHSMDSQDTPTEDGNITTKVAGEDFILKTTYSYSGNIVAELSFFGFPVKTRYTINNISITGSAGYNIYSGSTPLSDEHTIPTTTATASQNDTFNTSFASKDAYVRYGICIDSVTFAQICETFFGIELCIGDPTKATASLLAYNHATGLPSCGPNCEVATSADSKCYVDFNSTDHFAIRPNNFSITSATNLNSVTSAADLDLHIAALDASSLPIPSYTSTENKNIFITNFYNQDDSDASAIMEGNATITSSPTFVSANGISTDGRIQFDNVGKITLKIEDQLWAAIDIGVDTTPLDCSANGAYVCGDFNATFIPSSFLFEATTIKNANNATFTYLSGDVNSTMVPALDFTIKALNANNKVTTNFDKDSWQNGVNITLSNTTPNTPTFLKKEILAATDLGFENGQKVLAWNESNTSKQLRFTFERSISTPLNPIKINIGDITLTATSTYPTGDVIGTQTNTNSITLLYARTHAPRQRFDTSTGSSSIYFESFCYGTDTNGNTCDKTLLPNSTAAKYTDDPRWYVNPFHTSSAGVIGTPSQVGGSKTSIGTINAATGVTTVPITYNGLIFPYKARMQNNASSWLIYDQYSPAATPSTTNKFDIEFTNNTSSWAGDGKNSASTASSGATKTNRRTMW